MRLKLLKGDPIEVDGIDIYPLKLKDIVELGEDKYHQYLAVLVSEPEGFEEVKENNENITFFDLLCYYCLSNQHYKDLVLNALSLFFNERTFFHDKLMLFYLDENRTITKENFEKIVEVIRQQNCLTNIKHEKEVYADEKAREIGEKLKFHRDKIQKKPSDVYTLQDIMSGVSARHPSINLFNMWDLTIYQLYDQFQRLNMIDNYNNSFFLMPYSEDAGKNLKHWSTTIKEEDN